MQPILVDTSVWIDYLNGVSSPQTDHLYHYIHDDFPIFLCPIIVQEILQGIREDEQYETVKSSLLGFSILDLPAIDVAVGAADLYRSLRKKGVTIRKSNDCMIAFYAIHFELAVLHQDRDFELLSTYANLKVCEL